MTKTLTQNLKQLAERIQEEFPTIHCDIASNRNILMRFKASDTLVGIITNIYSFANKLDHPENYLYTQISFSEPEENFARYLKKIAEKRKLDYYRSEKIVRLRAKEKQIKSISISLIRKYLLY